MKLSSTDFEDGGQIPVKFTCQGEGNSPSLSWTEIPEEAKSLALSLVDPDASGGNFVHWLIINIPADSNGIDQNQTIGVELQNSAGRGSYVPPCPPSGEHRYIFTLYALGINNLELPDSKNFFEDIKPNIIDQARITGIFGRK